jgi:isochorismate pyruvate lyase
MAALVKNDETLIVDEGRIEDVIKKVTGFGESCGLSKSISEPLWRKLIELSIEHEFQELDLIRSSN